MHPVLQVPTCILRAQNLTSSVLKNQGKGEERAETEKRQLSGYRSSEFNVLHIDNADKPQPALF